LFEFVECIAPSVKVAVSLMVNS